MWYIVAKLVVFRKSCPRVSCVKFYYCLDVNKFPFAVNILTLWVLKIMSTVSRAYKTCLKCYAKMRESTKQSKLIWTIISCTLGRQLNMKSNIISFLRMLTISSRFVDFISVLVWETCQDFNGFLYRNILKTLLCMFNNRCYLIFCEWIYCVFIASCFWKNPTVRQHDSHCSVQF